MQIVSYLGMSVHSNHGQFNKNVYFFLPYRAKQVNKCVNEYQYYGNVVLLWLVLLCTCTFLIAYVFFTL
jgi:hypothetical protein